MVYKQGVNRVVNDDVFPYPLKCWYDDENIYVQVLRIPEPEECKLSPYIMRGVRDGLYDINNYPTKKDKRTYHGYRGNYLNKLCVCLEVEESRTLRYSSHHNRLRIKKHKGRSKKFYCPVIETNFNKVIKNNIYTFSSDFLNRQAYWANSQRFSSYPLFTRFRATFRFLKYGNRNNIGMLDRTGLYSNIITIKQ